MRSSFYPEPRPKLMINVIATITVKPECRDEFLKIFNDNVPAVLAESGCLEYFPCVDADSGLSIQEKDDTAVTIVEKWETLDALHAHLKAPHMAAYKEKVKDMVTGLSLKVLQKS